jgi:hypothetical protein
MDIDDLVDICGKGPCGAMPGKKWKGVSGLRNYSSSQYIWWQKPSGRLL